MANYTGTNTHDNIVGSAEADTLKGLNGNDTLDGGAGLDTAVYARNMAGYRLWRDDQGRWLVKDIDVSNGNEGSDLLINIDRLQFADRTIELSGRFKSYLNFPMVELSDGKYIVSWLKYTEGYWIYPEYFPPESIIYGQLITGDGISVGEPFILLSNINDVVDYAVSAMPDGGFVVVASDDDSLSVQCYLGDSSVAGEYFRIYNRNFSASNPSVAALADGSFVVVWESSGQDGSGSGVYGRRYDSTGAAIAEEFRVNSFLTGNQGGAEIKALSDGGFVVAWVSNGQDGSGDGIYAQRFDSAGTAAGGEFLVNAGTEGRQWSPTITALSNGGFLVTWYSTLADGVTTGIFGQRYAREGVAAGGEFLISATSGGTSRPPAVSAFPDGGFMVVWTHTSGEVLGRRYNGEAVAMGGDLVLSTTEASLSVTALPDGGFFLLLGDKIVRYDASDLPVTGPFIYLTSGADVINVGDSAQPVMLIGGNGDDTYIIGAGVQVREDRGYGHDKVVSEVSYTLGNNIEDLTLNGSAHLVGEGNDLANILTGNQGDNRLYGAEGNDILAGGAGNDTLMGGHDLDTVRLAGEAAGYHLQTDESGVLMVTDIDPANGNESTDIILEVEGLQFADRAWDIQEEIRVRPGTTEDLNSPCISRLADGGFVVTWTKDYPNSPASVIMGQRYNPAGQAVGSEFKIYSFSYYPSTNSSVAALADGGFVVVWYTGHIDEGWRDDDFSAIEGQRYNSAGEAVGGVFTVEAGEYGKVNSGGEVTPLMDGGFLVVWASQEQDIAVGSTWYKNYDVYGQRYDAAGVATGDPFRINSTTANDQNTLSVASLPDGGFVVAWTSQGQDGSGNGVYGQRFNSAGAATGPEFRVNSTTLSWQYEPTITALSDGGFVVSWTSWGQDGSDPGIYGQRFNSAGAATGPEFRINTHTSGSQNSPAITALSDGGFVVAWTSWGQDGSGAGVYAQRYDQAGVALGPEFQVNVFTSKDQRSPTLTALSDGGFIVAWVSEAQDGTEDTIIARRFDARGLPVLGVNGSDAADVMDFSDVRRGVLLGGGLGDDTYVVNSQIMTAEAAGEGVDTVISAQSHTLADHVENLELTGSDAASGTGNAIGNSLSGNDAANTLHGMGGNDVLYGRGGNDWLSGGSGADTLMGGAGHDTYIYDGSDSIVELEGEGIDTLWTGIDLDLGITPIANIEHLKLLEDAPGLSLRGDSGSNALSGNSRGNLLDGGAGADMLAGGLGNDSYVVDDAGDVVTESAGEGSDLVSSSISYVLGSGLEDLTLLGSEALRGTGNNGNNVLSGNLGDNLLDGKGGADTLAGGLGNDTYVLSAGDVIVEDAGAGLDWVHSGFGMTLGANVENLQLTGVGNASGYGNALDNILKGNAGNNLLDGRVGADSMMGGQGNDTYLVDHAGDLVSELSGEGTDLVRSTVSFVLGAGLEDLVLLGGAALNGTGNSGNNLLSGNRGDNLLDGRAGADTLTGGLGNDTYVFDGSDSIVELADGGNDSLWVGTDFNLGVSAIAHVENLGLLEGSGGLRLWGNSGLNVLSGNSGANMLDGKAGADTLMGGSGNDTYLLSLGDVVVESADGGIDEVRAGFSLTLGADVERLVMTGVANASGTGNSLDNYLAGNSGGNRLDGGGGADTMVGGTGNDSYTVDQAGDVVVELAGEGTDLVRSSVSFVLGSTLEHLTLTGTGHINGTGNSSVNVITGNEGANLLDGKAGADTLSGGLGDDTYVLSAGDVVTEGVNGGSDWVFTGSGHILVEHVENVQLTGTANASAHGNGQSNVLRGNSGHNLLSGKEGADTLMGGLGNDSYTLARGDGADLIMEADDTAGNADCLWFNGVTIAHDQLWFRRVGSDLEVSVIGTGDLALVKDWYVSSSNRVEEIRAGNGKTLLSVEVEALVSAMSGLTPPPLGQTTLDGSRHAALDAVIAANWS